MEYGSHAWEFKPLSELSSTELANAKEEVSAQRKAIKTSLMEPIVQQEKIDASRQERLNVITERAKEVAISAEQQAKNMQDFNIYMKGRAEETRELAKKNPVNIVASGIGGIGKTIGDAGAGLTSGLGGIGQTLSNITGGITSGLAGIGIFAVVIIGLIIVVLVMGRGF